MSFYQNNFLPKQWRWRPGIYFRQFNEESTGVLKLLGWTKSPGVARVASSLSDYKKELLITVSPAAYRVRKDGREYQRTSKLSRLSRWRNATQGRLAGIKSNLLGLINHEIQDPVYRELLAKNVEYTMQAIEAQIDWEWRKQTKESK